MNKIECEANGGVYANGVCITKEELECRKNGDCWRNGVCIPGEQIECENNKGIWENGVCRPLIFAYDCAEEVNDKMTPGQFAIGWETDNFPENTKEVNVHYKPEGKKARCYSGIKAKYPTPIIISGQKPDVEIVWHIEIVDSWGNMLGYSNEVVTRTKQK